MELQTTNDVFLMPYKLCADTVLILREKGELTSDKERIWVKVSQ